jgi:hypothetical protein
MVIVMGSSKDVMELFAERDIRQIFSAYDGWNIAPANVSRSTGRFFQVSRKKMYNEEVAFVAVSFDQVPGEEVISALDALPHGQGSKTKKYLLTPQAANTSAIPPHVRILLMNAFAFDGGNLVWLTNKKNAKKFPVQQPVAA